MSRGNDKETHALRGPAYLAAMEPSPTASTEIAAITKGLQPIMPALLNGDAAIVQLDQKGNVADTPAVTTK